METYLKAIIAVGIIILPWRYYYGNKLDSIRKDVQQTVNMMAAYKFVQEKLGEKTKYDFILEIIENRRKILQEDKRKIELLAPDFHTTRTSLLQPFELLRAKIPGNYNVIPDKSYREQGSFVFWPFDIEFEGKAENAIKLIAGLESNSRFMSIKSVKIVDNGLTVKLNTKIELVYQQNNNNNSGGTK